MDSDYSLLGATIKYTSLYGVFCSQGGFPSFIDVPAAEVWDPETCVQPRLQDWTGLDSLLSPVLATVVMFAWSAIEK